MRASRRTSTAVVAVAAALGGTACTLPGTEKPLPPAAATPAAQRGGTVTVALARPSGPDPAAVSDDEGELVSSLLCDTLVRLDPSTGAIRPGLVDSWVVADGGRSIQLKLGTKHVFADGSTVDSDAVARSFLRLANPNTGSHMAQLLEPMAGYREYRRSVEDGEERPSLFGGIRVIDRFRLEIVLVRPEPDFVRTLAHPATAPVDPDAAESDPAGFARNPACSGPYRLAEPAAPGRTELRLRRSDRYEGSTGAYTDAGRGWADEVVFRLVADAEAAYQLWARGEVDVAEVPAPRLSEVRRTHAGAVASAFDGQVEYIGLPSGELSPVADPMLRRALAAALDRQQIADEVYGGSRVPATGFIPPIAGAASRERACAFAPPSEAPAMPAEPLKLYFNDEFAHRRLVEAVAAQWRAKLGIAVEPVALGWDQYLQKATTGSGFDGAFRVSWTPPTLDAVSYVRPLVYSTFAGNSNLARFADREIDAMLDQDVARATDEGDRILALQRVEDRLCERLPLIPVAFGQRHVLVRGERLGSARADGLLVGRDGALLVRELVTR